VELLEIPTEPARTGDDRVNATVPAAKIVESFFIVLKPQ
jgi:hypothetical protein